MKQLTYTVKVNCPTDEEDHNYQIIIGSNGMEVGRITAPLRMAVACIPETIMQHVEENQ